MENLYDVLVEQLTDLYSAETQLVEALPKMVKASTTTELSQAFKAHLGETKVHVERLDQIADELEEKMSGKTCKAMKGLIKEAEDILGEDYAAPALKDAMIVAIAQKVEHYEIAGYGNAIALAQYLGYPEIADLLILTLEEEKKADDGMTDICEGQIFPACEEEGSDEEEGEDDEDVEHGKRGARP